MRGGRGIGKGSSAIENGKLVKPRVFIFTPTRGNGNLLAARSQCYFSTKGAIHKVPAIGTGSILTFNFNQAWAQALNYYRVGALEYFLIHHDDIEVQTMGWVDIMVDEMKRVGAAVLSAVVAIKDGSGLTSTAIEQVDPWNPRKLTLQELREYPDTFTDRGLLVNTGLMLIDLSRPEWHRVGSDGGLQHLFVNQDRIAEKDGEYIAATWPEDWEFSRRCNLSGIPVYATKKIRCKHWGDWGFVNYLPEDMG